MKIINIKLMTKISQGRVKKRWSQAEHAVLDPAVGDALLCEDFLFV
jgi:hypothetical protein